MTVLNLKVNNGIYDGYSLSSVFGNNFSRTSNVLAIGRQFLAGWPGDYSSYAFFVGASGISGMIINAAYTRLYQTAFTGANTEVCRVYAEDIASPTVPSNHSDFTGKTRTSNYVSWTMTTTNNEWKQSPDISNVIQELASSYSGISNILLLYDVIVPGGSTDQIRWFRAYEGNTSQAPELYIDYSPPNTPPTIIVNPSVDYNGYTRLGPSNTPGRVTFMATDPEETGSNALSYEIRTAPGSGGTLVASGNFTSGTPASVNIAHNASGLSEGSNTLWLRVYDGSEYAPTNPSFTLLVDRTQPTVGTITQTPNPAVP